MARTEVELVEDDAPHAGGPPDARGTGFLGLLRRHPRRSLVAGGAVLALVVAAVAGQAVLDARERARIARITALPGVLHPVDLPLRAQFTVTGAAARALQGARVGDLFVGGASGGGLSFTPRVLAVDARTGADVWQVTLDPPQLAEPPAVDDPGTEEWLWVGCSALARTDRVGCVVSHTYGYRYDERDGSVVAELMAQSAVVLDVADGSVLWRQDEPLGTDVSVVDDGFWLTSSDRERSAVHVLALDGAGDRRWEQWVPVPVSSPALSAASVQRATVLTDGSRAMLGIDGYGWALDVRDGTLLREMGESGGSGWFAFVPGGVLLQRYEGGGNGVIAMTGSTLWRDDGTSLDLGLDNLLTPSVDDGSAPGVTLVQPSEGNPDLRGLDRSGRVLWHAEVSGAQGAILVDGVVTVLGGDTLAAVDVATGAVRWQTAVPNAAQVEQLLFDGRSLLTVAGDDIGAYDAADGSPRWAARVSDEGGRGLVLRKADPADPSAAPDGVRPDLGQPAVGQPGPVTDDLYRWWAATTDGRLVRGSTDSTDDGTATVFR